VSVANLVASGAAGALFEGRYVLGERLGAGASGETYAASNAGGEPCVIKLFSAEAGPGAAGEFRRLEALAHRSVVRVRDIGRTADGRRYLVTDHVSGPSVDSVASIADDGRRRQVFERVASDLADALGHLHGRGIVHGDVSPANVRLRFQEGDLVRAVLIDFGLAGAPRSVGGGAYGTLGYAAPEALTGARTVEGDLFALGATLFEAWTGGPPFGRGMPAVQRMLAGPAPALSAVRGGLGPEWDRIVARLLAPNARDRPRSARELAREIIRASRGDDTPIEIDLGVPHPDGDPLEGLFVGRGPERESLRSLVERFAEGLGAPAAAAGAGARALVAVVGQPGAGRRTLIEHVVRDLAVATAAGVLPPVEVWRGDLVALERLMELEAPRDPEGDETRAAQRRHAALAEALERRPGRPLLGILAEGPATDAFATFWAGAAPSGRVLLIAPARAPIERPFAENLVLAPLGARDVAALVARAAGEAAPEPAIEQVVAASAGHAALAAVLARRLVQAMRAGRGGEVRFEPGADLDTLLADGLGSLSLEARRLVVGLAVAAPDGREAGASEALDVAAAEARAAGWLSASPFDVPRLPSEAHQRAALAALATPELAEVAHRAADVLPADDPRRADALAALGRRAEAAHVLRSAASRRREEGRLADAALLLERTRAIDGAASLSLDEELALATGLAIVGRYDDATLAVERAAAYARNAVENARVAERRAWLLTRQGDLGAARAVLEQGLAGSAGSAPDAEAGLRARLGRLLVTGGRFRDALEVLEPLLGGVGMADPLALEGAILAHAYQGELERARARAVLLDAIPEANPARRAYLAALVEQLAGDGAAAVTHYRRAYELAQARAEVHTLAAVALNLGALLADQGLYGEALGATERAVRELGRLGATSELGTALANAANLLLQLGDGMAARRALGRARDEAARRGVPLVDALATFVDGDLARREGRLSQAVALYRAAAGRFVEVGQPRRAASALLAATEILALTGELAAAAAALAEAAGLRADDGGDDPEVASAEARLALAGGAVADLRALADRVAARAAEALAHCRRPVGWRLGTLAARLYHRAVAADRAQAALSTARQVFEEVRMATPEHHRAGLDGDSDARWLAAPATFGDGGRPAGDPLLAAHAAEMEARLRRLLRINKRLNSEQRLPRLLEMIVDTVIELTDAERGFLLLEDDAGELVVKVARNIDQRTLDTAEFELSRSIARKAASGGEPIVTIDAAGDDRWKEALSVSGLHLRSVLAVPLQIKGRAAGTVYVDHRLRRGAFGENDVRLVLDFAEQAAIAIENARLLAELRRRERQVEALNRRLEVELAVRREELTGMKQELASNREALAVRYDYRNIVGRTPRMLELFRLLDRLTDTALPVVIQGESGTGKELVARAIHFNGPRKGRPFVSENCAAIPETLLESTLFGYARGAFTGADHDTRGLFEVADGGTLFLDEIGEMSPAMQGKLLRVLQVGEFRRVGSERMRKVDVRIVAATNRDLARMVDEGRFRQDLYFRLNVARISLPPLRERREDIPLIVERFLEQHAATAGQATPKLLDPAALARLVAYRWPGNVRELENEITRAYALSGERISAADLSPHVASAGTAGEPAPSASDDPDSLLLRPRVERLERALLREALGRCGQNQTKAAELLGLSRFGLQKKLKRYRFA
jgi:transcriptional regulator with GAF, ATPase, and Fis domain